MIGVVKIKETYMPQPFKQTGDVPIHPLGHFKQVKGG